MNDLNYLHNKIKCYLWHNCAKSFFRWHELSQWPNCVYLYCQSVKRNFQCELSVILSHINLLNSDKILHNHILLFLLLLSSVWKTDFTLICICSSFSLKIKRRVFLSLSPSLCLHSAPHMGRQTNTMSSFMDSNVSFEWNCISIPVAWVTLKRGERRREKAFVNLFYSAKTATTATKCVSFEWLSNNLLTGKSIWQM